MNIIKRRTLHTDGIWTTGLHLKAHSYRQKHRYRAVMYIHPSAEIDLLSKSFRRRFDHHFSHLSYQLTALQARVTSPLTSAAFCSL